jgi:hypothetical protein
MAYTLTALKAAKAQNEAKLSDVSSFEVARYRDFDPTEFGPPPEGWQPTYPYHWNDVSFVRVNV